VCAGRAFTLELAEIGRRLRVSNLEEVHSLWWQLVKILSPLDLAARRTLLEEIRRQLSLPENWKTTYLQNQAGSSRFMVLNREELTRLTTMGMTIGAHSLSHSVLASLSREAAWKEIAESRERLEQALGCKVWAFAYPFGGTVCVSQRDVKMAEQAGFSCAFLNVGGGFGAETVRFALPRVHVTGEMSLAEFEAHVSGFYGSLRRRFLGEAAGTMIGLGA